MLTWPLKGMVTDGRLKALRGSNPGRLEYFERGDIGSSENIMKDNCSSYGFWCISASDGHHQRTEEGKVCANLGATNG